MLVKNGQSRIRFIRRKNSRITSGCSGMFSTPSTFSCCSDEVYVQALDRSSHINKTNKG